MYDIGFTYKILILQTISNIQAWLSIVTFANPVPSLSSEYWSTSNMINGDKFDNVCVEFGFTRQINKHGEITLNMGGIPSVKQMKKTQRFQTLECRPTTGTLLSNCGYFQKLQTFFGKW
jgi:hypothetical protein